MFWICSSFRRMSLWRARHQSSDTLLFRFLMESRGNSLSSCCLLLLPHRRGHVWTFSWFQLFTCAQVPAEGQRSAPKACVIRLKWAIRTVTW